MPLSSAPRPPRPSRVSAILGRRGEPEASSHGDPRGSSRPIDAEALDAQLRRARRPGVVTMPEQLRLGRLAVSTSAVVALLALVLAVGCAFVIRILWAERNAVPQAAQAKPAAGLTVSGETGVPTAPGHETGPVGPSPGPADPATSSASAQVEVVVHVAGAVKKPGLVRLASGARVADALTAAGGAAKGADLAALNLARPVSDGEQVYVPKPGESPPVAAGANGAGGVGGTAPGGASGQGGATGSGSGGAGTGVVNLNTADLAALDSLPGVGPVLAQRILDWRAEHGRFSSVAELGEVSGIGDKLLAQLTPKVTV